METPIGPKIAAAFVKALQPNVGVAVPSFTITKFDVMDEVIGSPNAVEG